MGQFDEECLPGDPQVAGLELAEVDAGFDNAVGDHEDAAFAEASDPFDVFEHDDFFNDVLDGDQFGDGLDLLEESGGVVGFGSEAEAGPAGHEKAEDEAEAGGQEESDDGQAGFGHGASVKGKDEG